MFSKHINKNSLVKSGSATIIASLSLLLGIQIAAHAVPMSACENGREWIQDACTVSAPGTSPLVLDGDCIDRKCEARYPGNNDAQVACIWCAERG